MQGYDDIVVGAGISGMTIALLSAIQGRSVLLLEKAPYIGGSMARFYLDGLPFDSGFHFTGGFSDDAILSDMLKVLGIDENIKPLFFDRADSNEICFEDSQNKYYFPLGYAATVEQLKIDFPDEHNAIDNYFTKVREIFENTPSMQVRTITESPKFLKEDSQSLSEYLDTLTQNSELKSVLASYALCYGTGPQEVSLANHARAAFNLYQSVAKVKDGGKAFVDAFKAQFKSLGVTVKTNTTLLQCLDVEKRKVAKFVLSDGGEVNAKNCIFAIHPQEIVKVLPHDKVSKAFLDRVDAFESSIGLFTVYAKVADDKLEAFEPSMVTILPDADFNKYFSADYDGPRPLVIVKGSDKGANLINAFELSLPQDVELWVDSKRKQRNADYDLYKQERTQDIKNRILKRFPEYAQSLEIIDSASMLTYKDYLNSPLGCAYGIKQKIGQFNLLGRLPLKNLYAVGQSSVLPGIVGAMISSFIIGRQIFGHDEFAEFIEKQLNI